MAYHFFPAGILIAIILFRIWQQRFSKKQLLIFIFSFLFWLFHFYLTFAENALFQDGEERNDQIRFAEYPRFDGDRLQGVVRNEAGEKFMLFYELKTEQEKRQLKSRVEPGMTCKIHGVIESPRGPTNPNAFDYRIYLRTRGISYILTVTHMDECAIEKQSFLDFIFIIRKKGMDRIDEYFPDHAAPFIHALLFGYSDAIDPETMDAYQSLGISHLLAISGTHISILTIFLYVLFVRCGFTKEMAANFLLIFLPVYSVLAGSSPSVNRAVLMSWLLLFLGRRRFSLHPLDALGCAYTFFIVVNPYLLYHVGFQLSYLISAGLILSRRILQRFGNPLLQLVLVSWIAQWLSIPVLLYHFYEFSLLSFFVNLLYVPFYSLIILPFSLLIFMLLLVLPGISAPLINLLSFLLQIANQLAKWFHSFPQFTIILGKPTGVLFLLYCLCFLLVLLCIEQGAEHKKKYIIMLILTPFLLHLLLGKFSPRGEVTILDVGQGDSIFIRLPLNQGNYLIDTGGVVDFNEESWRKRTKTFDPGENIVIPFLKSRGVDHLDKLIITHGDWDHLGSARTIVASFSVNEVVIGQTLQRKDTEKELYQLLTERGIPVTEVYRGLRWQEGRYSFYILAPEKNALSGNNASLVLFTKLGGYRWLLTGDLETAGEMELISTYPKLQADVLKVGHHGSRTSSSPVFLDQIKPEVAIISAGRNNRFGHPHLEVIERLEERQIHIFRTDMHGAITYSFFREKGKFTYQIETERHPFR